MTVVSFTTRARHGDARAKGVLARHLHTKKIPTAFAHAKQVHGTRIEIIPSLKKSKKFSSTDGLLTDAGGQPLVIFTADCVPIFVSADGGRVVGALHAGWRGTKAGILKKAVRLLRRRWGIAARKIKIWLGPAIGPCCFEVQWDVARHFPTSRKRRQGRWTVDLIKELRAQARQLHVQVARSDSSCTMHNKQFHSYRRDQTDQRLASVIMKKS